MKINRFSIVLLIIFALITPKSWSIPNISIYPIDLKVPEMIQAKPAAGKRVKMVLASYKETEVYHSLYLPSNWKKGVKYPVIFEYAGNGPYKNKLGDRSSGKVEDSNLGYGITEGKNVIWVCVPYISKNGKKNQLKWWGSPQKTVDYLKQLIEEICNHYGGDREQLFIAGFSRGAIACNYIGLYDDDIAKVWKGFICHSHYEGVRKFKYEDNQLNSALMRLQRLGSRPQFISHEKSIKATKQYLKKHYPNGSFTFMTLPFSNHTDTWVLRDTKERQVVRDWFEQVVNDKK